MTEESTVDANLLELTADIVAAYIANNAVQSSSLPDLIASVHASVAGLRMRAVVAAETLVPAVNPKKSVHPDCIICLEDGKKFKSLKRHLGIHGLTPAEYRARWGLARDYPMVAPNYAAERSAMAKRLGLGRKPAAVAASVIPKKTKGPAKGKAAGKAAPKTRPLSR